MQHSPNSTFSLLPRFLRLVINLFFNRPFVFCCNLGDEGADDVHFVCQHRFSADEYLHGHINVKYYIWLVNYTIAFMFIVIDS